MARQANGSVFRPVVVRKVNGRKVRRRSKFYWTHYVDANGDRQRHAMKLPNGMKITDRDVARAELERINNRIEREVVGLAPDPFVVAAGMPMRRAVATGRNCVL